MSFTFDSDFVLLPAERQDAPRIVEIEHAAFASDVHTLMKMSERGTTDIGSEMPADGLYKYFDGVPKGECTILKVVERASGMIVGYANWAFWHYDGSKPKLPEGVADPRLKDLTPSNGMAKPAEDACAADRLNYMTGRHFAAMEANVLLPLGERRIYCCGISVDPAYQRRWVGSALVRWATQKADEDGVKVWIHASEAGYELVRKHGFELVEELPLNLDEWATKQRIVDGKETTWGTYTLRYMMRDPIV